MRKSISIRIFKSTTLLLLSGVIIMGFVHMYLSINYFQQESEKSLAHTIDTIMSIFDEYRNEDNSSLDSLIIGREVFITARATGDLIFITDTQGTVYISNDMFQATTFMGTSFPKRAIDSTLQTGSFSEISNLGKYTQNMYYWSGKPIYNEEAELVGYIFAASDASSLYAYTASTFSMFLISAALMLILSSVFSIWMTARIAAPLREMAEATKKFGAGDFTVRIKDDGDEEIMQLSQSFNAMAQSLQKIDSSRASFMGDIAHELRTPMTSIKGFIDGMLDGTIPKENTEHYLQIVSDESARLTRLIKNMLDITKLEAGEYVVNAQYYDIWESITNIVFAAEQRISKGDIKLCGFTPTRTIVYADPDLIHQVIYNIFDNALKFCPAGGEICFNVVQEKNRVKISIRNTGEGIESDAIPYVFERFYKEDKSRGMNTSGSGLGLHICKVLVTLSDGEIWATSTPGVDCIFSFTLPVAPKNGTTNAKSTTTSTHGVSRKLPGATLNVNAVTLADNEKEHNTEN